VGTPCGQDGKADLSYLFAAIDSVCETVGDDCLLVVKSTVPPGTAESEILPYLQTKGIACPVAVNPEFLREGHCWEDFMFPDRIVCGVRRKDDKTVRILSEIYEPFNAPLRFVDFGTAEFIKYLSNSLLANLISFSNETALIAESAGNIAVSEAFRILHEDKRLKDSGICHYIYPGCGYGGYCLPKDTVTLLSAAQANGFTPRILKEVIALNDDMPGLTAEKIGRAAGNRNSKIGILGLSFKPNSDDVRNSPAAKIIDALSGRNYVNIFAFDPAAKSNFAKTYGLNITYCDSADEVCGICDTVAIVTAWEQFRGINGKYPGINFVDCRYCL
jgi:UDPglucose 6-dehydrogenase